MARPTRLMPDQEYIYFIGLETHPSACYILYDESTATESKSEIPFLYL